MSLWYFIGQKFILLSLFSLQGEILKFVILEGVVLVIDLGIFFRHLCSSEPPMYLCKFEYFDLYSKLELQVTLM